MFQAKYYHILLALNYNKIVCVPNLNYTIFYESFRLMFISVSYYSFYVRPILQKNNNWFDGLILNDGYFFVEITMVISHKK